MSLNFVQRKKLDNSTRPAVEDRKYKIPEFDKRLQDLAYLSDLAYKDPGQRLDYLTQNHLTHYTIDDEFNSDNHVLLINSRTGEKVLSFRGTATAQDLGTDIALTLGKENTTKRYKESNRIVDKVLEKHGDELTLTGHSLGGGIAENIARKKDLNAVGFNGGASIGKIADLLGDNIDELLNRSRKNTITNITTGYDPISLLNRFAGPNDEVILVKQRGSNIHGMDNFLN